MIMSIDGVVIEKNTSMKDSFVFDQVLRRSYWMSFERVKMRDEASIGETCMSYLIRSENEKESDVFWKNNNHIERDRTLSKYRDVTKSLVTMKSTRKKERNWRGKKSILLISCITLKRKWTPSKSFRHRFVRCSGWGNVRFNSRSLFILLFLLVLLC